MRGVTYSADVLSVFCMVVVLVRQGAQRRGSNSESHAPHRANYMRVMCVVDSGESRSLWITVRLWTTACQPAKWALTCHPKQLSCHGGSLRRDSKPLCRDTTLVQRQFPGHQHNHDKQDNADESRTFTKDHSCPDLCPHNVGGGQPEAQ